VWLVDSRRGAEQYERELPQSTFDFLDFEAAERLVQVPTRGSGALWWSPLSTRGCVSASSPPFSGIASTWLSDFPRAK